MTSLLISHPDLSFYGGAELVITELCCYLAAHQIDHDVLTTRVSPQIRALTPKTNYITCSPSWSAKFQTGTAYSFWKYLKHHPDWDVINAHNYPTHQASAASSLPTVWLCNEPPYYHIQADELSHSAVWAKKMLLSADKWLVRHRIEKVIVADSFNQKRFFQLYQRPSHIIPYGIDYSFFAGGDKQQAIDRYHLDDQFVMLHVGLFSPFKNQIISVKTLQQILPDEPNAALVLAGQGGTLYEQDVRRYVNDHHLEDQVIFTGHITREEVRNLYHAAHLALFPVRSQGSWLSPFEALCAGTPVVVSPDITSSSIISEEKIGMITTDYSGAVRTIIQDYAYFQKQALRGKQWVKENLKWRTFCQKMLEHCESVIRR